MDAKGFVIDPRGSKWMPHWDIVMVFALLFVAIVTPVEVTFSDEGKYISVLWVINRVVDLLFIFDIVLLLNLAYQTHSDDGGHWIVNKRRIVIHYLKGWFFVDFISVLPFWAITMDYNDIFGLQAAATNAAMIENSVSESDLRRATVLFRTIKLLRLLKLARVLKASRILQRHLIDIIMVKLEFTYAVLKMLKLVVLLLLWVHWQACLWGLVSNFMDDLGYPNWISHFKEEHLKAFGELTGPATSVDIYGAALYWSAMTLTSIGYGEMLPINTAERYLCACYMFISGVVWTYAIGSVASIATTLDPNGVLFHNTMDSLNYFMRERSLPRPMRHTLREYFQSARKVHQVNQDADLLHRMSPLLQGTVALAANKRWLDHIWFFRDMGITREGREFIAAVAKVLVIRAFISHERLPIGQLYVLRRGLVVKMWRFLGRGKTWGEDMVLDSLELMDHSQAVALTYVETFTLRRNDLEEVLLDFPIASERIRKAARRITMQRALLKYMCVHVKQKSVRSFAPRSEASGFTEVRNGMSLEQKVDTLLGPVLEQTLNDPNAVQELDGGSNPSPKTFKRQASALMMQSWVKPMKTSSPHRLSGAEASPGIGRDTSAALKSSIDQLAAQQKTAFDAISEQQSAMASQLLALTQAVAELKGQSAGSTG